MDEIDRRIGGNRVAVFLDYDGTLTPIVVCPELAILSDDMRGTMDELARLCTVAVISGRAREDVQGLVGLDSIVYAGCHGFDIAGPARMGVQYQEGRAAVPTIHEAVKKLRARLDSIDGVRVEDKRCAVAVHYRLVDRTLVRRIEDAVDRVQSESPGLRKKSGKKVFELLPDVDWDKGRAVLWLLDALGLDQPDVLPVYLGDDVTDRDAFEVLHGRGVSLLVAECSETTRVDYRLRNPGEVRIFLERLIGLLRERGP